jgi:hypothetical protein
VSQYSVSRTLISALGGLTIAGGLLASYASGIEPYWPEIVRLSLALPRLSPSLDGLTVVQISDLHVGYAKNHANTQRSVQTVNALHPDLVVVTGDMIQGEPEEALLCAAELAAIDAPLGVYAIMGNHERRLPPREGELPFRRAGLTVLSNAAHEIVVDGASLWIVGLDDLIMRRGDFNLALHEVPDESCKILLVHEPDIVDRAAQFPIDLQLSGHTHGGQVRLPGVGALLLPILGRKYPMGLYRVHDTWVYTNRGLGVTRPAMRFNCRPEITEFTLRAANDIHSPAA